MYGKFLSLKMSTRTIALTALISVGAGTAAYALHAWIARRERVAVLRVLDAAVYASVQHRDQRRKNPTNEPYFNHPLRVARSLAAVGASERAVIAGLLHDTVEDTDSTPEELEAKFGAATASVVAEVTDDKTLPKAERKRLQVEHAPLISRDAKMVKLADKTDNLTDLVMLTPVGWTPEYVDEYFKWSQSVISGLRGTSAELERKFDAVFAQRETAVQNCTMQLAASTI